MDDLYTIRNLLGIIALFLFSAVNTAVSAITLGGLAIAAVALVVFMFWILLTYP